MKVQRIEKVDGKDEWKVFMEVPEYKIMLESVQKPKHRIAMRLMSASLRRITVTKVERDDFYKCEKTGMWFLRVEAKPEDNDDSDPKTREVWIPDGLMQDIQDRFGHMSSDSKLFPVSESTINNWVNKAGEAAAMKTGNDDYKKISPHDFRRYFATHYLFRHNVDREVVQQVGGWKSYRSMINYLLLPNDVLSDRLEESGVMVDNPDQLDPEDPNQRLLSHINRLDEHITAVDDREVLKEAGQSLIKMFDDVPGLELNLTEAHMSDSDAAKELGKQTQKSLARLEETDGNVSWDSNDDGSSNRIIDPIGSAWIEYSEVLHRIVAGITKQTGQFTKKHHVPQAQHKQSVIDRIGIVCVIIGLVYVVLTAPEIIPEMVENFQQTAFAILLTIYFYLLEREYVNQEIPTI